MARDTGLGVTAEDRIKTLRLALERISDQCLRCRNPQSYRDTVRFVGQLARQTIRDTRPA